MALNKIKVNDTTTVNTGVVYDITKATGQKYDTLSAALGTSGNNVPPEVREGGMSIRFVSNSDNKYVQYRLTADDWSVDTKDWAIADEGVYVENPEFVYVKTDAEGKILWAINADGGIYYGAGVPQQVIDCIETYEYDKTTIDELLNEKVDKIEGKSLIDAEYASSQDVVENPEWLSIITDNDGKILRGRKADGTLVENCDVEFNGKTNISDSNIIKTHFQKGYINWTDGGILPLYNRCYSEKFCFDFDVYVGFRSPIYTCVNTVVTNALEYRIYEYDKQGNYIGVYQEPFGVYEGRESYSQVNTLIPKETTFAIVLRYFNEEATPEYDMDYIINNQSSIFGISKTPLYYDVPSYYFNRVQVGNETDIYLNSKIKTIDSMLREVSGNGDAFIFITDVHFERNQQHSPALIKYLSSRLNIPRMFNTGDDFDGGAVDVYRVYKEAFKGKYYWAAGNHDIFEYDTTGRAYPLSTYSDVDSTHFPSNSDIVYGDRKYGYYYVDNNADKVRYIILNSVGDNNEPKVMKYDEQQMNWLSNTALNVESGWTILIFTHIIFSKTTLEEGHYRYSLPGGATARFLPIIENYSGNGTIAAIFCGDCHNDRMFRLSNHSNVPVIMSTCDGVARFNVNTSKRNTIYEQAFDVVILNKELRKISMVRIGDKAWNGVGYTDTEQGSQVEIREISY